jgi:hypothetical protein
MLQELAQSGLLLLFIIFIEKVLNALMTDTDLKSVHKPLAYVGCLYMILVYLPTWVWFLFSLWQVAFPK